MNQQTTPPVSSHSNLQVNHGDHHRIAFRDYHEGSTPDTIQMYLATTPAAQIDAESIDNEFLFRHRFGFDANPFSRAKVIALKTQLQMTDEEFISLRKSGQISVKRTEVKISPDRSVPIVGWLYLSIISFYLLPSMLVIALCSAPFWQQYLGLITLGAIWLAAVWFISKTHIHPWRLLKQIGALQSAGTPMG